MTSPYFDSTYLNTIVSRWQMAKTTHTSVKEDVEKLSDRKNSHVLTVMTMQPGGSVADIRSIIPEKKPQKEAPSFGWKWKNGKIKISF
jgi:hypothetical protein